MPGAVKVKPNELNIPTVNNKFNIKAILATHPAVLKYSNMSAKITKKAIRKESPPPMMVSLPRVGPTCCS